MKTINFGKILLASGIIMALTPGVIIADEAMSGASENTGMTSTTPLPPPKPNNTKPKPKPQPKPRPKPKKQPQQNQNVDPNAQHTQLQDIPAPDDLNSD